MIGAMNSNASTLSDTDIKALQEMLLEKDAVIEKKSEVIAQLKQRIDHLEAYLRLARDKQFGKSSEAHPDQPDFFNEVEKIADEAEAEPEQNAASKKPGRNRFLKIFLVNRSILIYPKRKKPGQSIRSTRKLKKSWISSPLRCVYWSICKSVPYSLKRVSVASKTRPCPSILLARPLTPARKLSGTNNFGTPPKKRKAR